MELILQHPWRKLVQMPLAEPGIAAAIADDHPQWEWIDREITQLGSLTHNQVDLDGVQQRSLALLAEESKDMRVMTHLLRTLQQGGKPTGLLLALMLLNDYAEHFWLSAWPQNRRHKQRFAQQILKRFAGNAEAFCQNAVTIERECGQRLLQQLQQRWLTEEPALATEVNDLLVSYARGPAKVEAESESAMILNTDALAASGISIAAPKDSVDIDSSSERAWRHTLLKVAELLCQRQADEAIGYRLRRHAIWAVISAAPQAKDDGQTSLAAVSADRVADYIAAIPEANRVLWQQVENSLTLSPYWLEGHYISAQIAQKLGFQQVASAIKDELTQLLIRLPMLKELKFNDRTPFLTVATAKWLQQESIAATNPLSYALPQDDIWQCYQQNGLEVALQEINRYQLQQKEPRERFYSQLFSAQLLEQAGLEALAQQQYLNLLQAAQTLPVTDWEPALVSLLIEKSLDQTVMNGI